MKVVYLTMFFPGANETFALNDIRSLTAKGVDVRVFTLRGRYPGEEKTLERFGLSDISITRGTLKTLALGLGLMAWSFGPTLDVTRLIVRRCAGNPKQLIKSLLLLPNTLYFFQCLRKDPPDVVHLFWGHYPSILGYLVKKYLPTPVLSHFLGAYDLDIRYPVAFEVAKMADAVWTHVRHNLPILASHGIEGERVRVVTRGAKLTGVDTRLEKKDPFLIVAAGRLKKHKAFPDVLHAFSRIREAFPEARLVLCGDGPEKKNLERQCRELGIDDAVALTGYIPQKDLFAYMKQATVFLHMSLTDWAPNVVKEAALRGCVCVVTYSSGMEDLIPSAEYGFVLPPHGIDEAVTAVSEVLRNPELASKISSNAHEYICENFDVDKSMERYRQTWSELLSR